MSPASPTKPDEVTVIQQELLGYIEEMKTYSSLEPWEAMERIGAISARVLELTAQTLVTNSRPLQMLRLEWLERIKEELKFQYTVSSRRFAIQNLEWEQAK
jgi:hypothetical protein